MQGYYEIEKHKAELVDGEWIPIELIETRIEKNNIDLAARIGVNGAYTGVTTSSTVNSDGFPVFSSNQRLFISSLRVYSKSWKNGSENTDSSSESTTSLVRGDHSTGKEQPILVLGTPNTITTEARWNPPTNNARAIYTIGCYYSNSPISSVTLNIPCIQQTNELLIIKYRYNWYEDSSNEYTDLEDPDAAFFLNKRQAMASDYYNPFAKPTRLSFSSYDITSSNDPVEYYTNGLPLTNGIRQNYNEGYADHTVSLGNADGVGRLFSSVHLYSDVSNAQFISGMGEASYSGMYINLFNTKMRRPTDTAINSTFHKSLGDAEFAKVPKPFLDTDFIGNGLGSAALSDNLSSGDTSYESKNGFAELYRTHIIDSGAIGDSTYKISKKLIVGFASQNSWFSRVSSRLPHISAFAEDKIYTRLSDGSTPKDTGLWADECDIASIGWYIGQYSFPEFISVNSKPSGRNAVFVRSIHAIDQNDYFEWSAGTTPSLPVTEIKTVEGFLDGTIVVACANTGLWKIERTIGEAANLATITHITPTGLVDNTKCQAFCTNSPSHTGLHGTKWWALFSTELAYSEDQGATWTVLNAGTSPQFILTDLADADAYNRLIGMHVDAVHVDERMCFLSSNIPFDDDGTFNSAGTSTRYASCYWWSVGGSTTTSDQLLTNANVSAGQYFMYPLHGNNCVHTILGTDQWVVVNTLCEFRSSSVAVRSMVSGSNPACMKYDDDLGQYLYYVRSQYSYSSNLFESYRNGLTLNNIEGYLDGQPMNVKIFSAGENNGSSNLNVSCNFIHLGAGLTMIRSDKAFYGGSPSYYAESSYVDGIYIVDHSVGDPTGLGNNDGYISGGEGAWEYYGWNGTNWVKDFNGTKPTHTTNDLTVSGLSIQFEELAGSEGSATNFVADDVYDTYVFDGIVKDDTTEFTTEFTSMYGPGAKGTGTFPSSVPNPIGVTTMPFAFESHLQEDTISNCKFTMEIDYIGQFSPYNTPKTGSPDGLIIGADLDGDFSIKFGMSCNYYAYNMPTNLASAYHAFFGLSTKSSIDPLSANVPDFGVFIQYNNDNPDLAKLRMITLSTETTYDITDFDPINDEYEFVRVGSTLELKRNGDLVIEYGTNISGVLKGTMTSKSDYFSLNIWDATVTFDDIRHVVKVGDGSTTGAFDPNFAKLSYEYFAGSGNGEIFLDGVKADILPADGVSLPTAGSVYVCRGTGELSFNSADVGKAITANWLIIPKVNDSRI